MKLKAHTLTFILGFAVRVFEYVKFQCSSDMQLCMIMCRWRALTYMQQQAYDDLPS